MRRKDVLLGLVRERGWTRGAEVGVLDGNLTFHLLDNCSDLHMTIVDLWAADNPIYGDLRQRGEVVMAHARTYGGRATILHGDSVAMASQVEDGSLDFCFIDAAHDRKSVEADIAAWAPKVRAGGAVMGHDIDFPEVEAAVMAEYGSYQALADDVWSVPKG